MILSFGRLHLKERSFQNIDFLIIKEKSLCRNFYFKNV